MNYRGPSFLAVVWLLQHPLHFSPVSKHHRRHTDRMRTRERVEGRGGAKLYNGNKAWSSLNHSILSASWHRLCAMQMYVPTTVRGVCTTICFITLDYLVTSSLSLFRKARTTASFKVRFRGKRVRTHNSAFSGLAANFSMRSLTVERFVCGGVGGSMKELWNRRPRLEVVGYCV